MRATHAFKVYDSHAGGAPSRLVLSGLPTLPGDTVMDKMRYFAHNHDWIRRALVLEPRGSNQTSCVVLLSPSRPDADVAAFFMEAHGYLPMCGSDTISTVTALVETGQIPATEPETVVRIETPAGLIEATARVDRGHVTGVTFVGAPAFCSLSQARLEVPGFGTVTVDVSYGGNFYVIADATQFDLSLDALNTGPAVEAATRLWIAVNDTFDIVHPQIPQIRGVTHVQFFLPNSTPQDPTVMMVIVPVGNVDRSPCGTGTTAKVATLHARHQLSTNEPFVHQSVTGAQFTGRAVETTTVGHLPAVRVAITGTAYLIADATIFVDEADELALGFQLA